MSPDPLKQRIRDLIARTLKLDAASAAAIADSTPLFDGGLDLDSIDALELVVALEKEFGIKIATSEEARTALASVDRLAEFIREKDRKGSG